MQSHVMTFRAGSGTWVRYFLAAFILGSIVMMTGCNGHGRVEGFEPVWDKLLVEVASFPDTQPAGVAVSNTGRVFVNFPYWSIRPDQALVEVYPDGSTRPYPSRSWNNWDGKEGSSALRSFVCVQAIHVDQDDYLWVLDSGNPRNRSGVITAGPKLFKIDLADDTIAQVFYIDHNRDLRPFSYLEDFRIDQDNGYAYISDSGRGCFYIYNLRSRESHSALVLHDSTKAEEGIEPRIGSEYWRGLFGQIPQIGVAGVALSPDSKWLYYQSLTGRTLYRVPTAQLRDPKLSEGQVARHVQKLGDTGTIVDSMWMDANENLYLTALEKDAILVRRVDGQIETFVADERMQWPDALAMGPDGYLYFTTSMRHLHTPYRLGTRTGQPYFVMKVSLANVERAIAKKQAAEDRRRAAMAAAREAERAARQAQIKQRRAQVEQEVAKRRSDIAKAAQEMARVASQAFEKAEQSMQQAYARQQEAASKARLAAEEAQRKADEANLAAQLAAKAAEEARIRAEEAQQKMKQTALAKSKVRQTEAQAAVAERNHQQAVAEADAARSYADKVQDGAERILADAVQAGAQAEKLADEADVQAFKAEQLAQQAKLARQEAATAMAEAKAAELVEIGGEPSAFAERQDELDVETASVPTD